MEKQNGNQLDVAYIKSIDGQDGTKTNGVITIDARDANSDPSAGASLIADSGATTGHLLFKKLAAGKGVVLAGGDDMVTVHVLASNPTAKTGLTAVNGAATTFMRSDAAPALDLSIAPTWLGAHIFGGAAPTIAKDQTKAAPGEQELITRKYADANYRSGGGSGANPTAKIGLTAVNGSATTLMRSDAAPALDQSIAPTWKGTHLFNKTGKQMVQFADAVGDANTTRTDLASLDTPYIGVGGSEWNKAYYVIGYGYSKNAATYPVLVGSHEVTTSGNTTGEFIVATRGSSSPSAPTVKFKVTPDGRPEITNNQTASGYTVVEQELITRAYAEKNFGANVSFPDVFNGQHQAGDPPPTQYDFASGGIYIAENADRVFLQLWRLISGFNFSVVNNTPNGIFIKPWGNVDLSNCYYQGSNWNAYHPKQAILAAGEEVKVVCDGKRYIFTGRLTWGNMPGE
ncbi:hypothetical protein [Pandoraea sputorum]|uniref:Uncharacterized protein n=1 Tax=Pandoraea sputorum TaxID=93222 RepID=A0A5E5ARX0_9BURK|nr:hypothetical protein [Pandoraea sputorum]VVE75757.1 hypothetical protein PSP31121_00592 [Pandoraea sputorum]